MSIVEHRKKTEALLRSGGNGLSLDQNIAGTHLWEGLKMLMGTSLQLSGCTIAPPENDYEFALSAKCALLENKDVSCNLQFSNYGDGLSVNFIATIPELKLSNLINLKLLRLPTPAAFLSQLSFSKVEIQLDGDSKAFLLWSESSDHEFGGLAELGFGLKKMGIEYCCLWEGGSGILRLLFTSNFMGSAEEFSIKFDNNGELNFKLESRVNLNQGIAALLDSLGKWTGAPKNNSAPLFPAIPEGIMKLPQLHLENLNLQLDAGKVSLTQFEATMTVGKYELVKELVALENARLCLSGIKGPYGWAKYVRLSAGLSLGVGQRVDISAVLSSSKGENWTFHLAGGVDIKKLTQLNHLPVPFKIKDLLLPENFLEIRKFTLEHLEVEFNPWEKTVESLYLDLNFDLDIHLVPGLKISNPRIFCSIEHPLHSTNRSITGALFSTITLAGCDFNISAEKNTDHWLFKGYTGENQKFSFRKFATEMAANLGLEAKPDQLLPQGYDVTLRDLSISYHSKNKEIEFSGISETKLKLPFLANPDTEIATFLNILCKEENKKYKFEWSFTGVLKIATVQLGVRCDYKKGESLFRAGWKMRPGEKGITIKDVLNVVGIEASLDGPLAVELTEVVIEYQEKNKQLTFAAYTSGKSLAFLVARKPKDKWEFAVGLEYDVSKSEGEGETKELVQAARTAGLTRLSLIYAGMDLKEFTLPSVPDLSNAAGDYPAKGRTITLVKGLHFVGEVKNISLPAIGKVQPDLKHFYLAVSKTTKVEINVKGNVQLMFANSRKADFSLTGAYTGGNSPAVVFEGEVKFDPIAGLQDVASAVLPEGFALPSDVKWGGLTKAEMKLDTAKGNFSFALTSDGAAWGMEELATIGFKTLTFAYADSAFSFTADGRFATPLLKDVLENEDGGIEGQLSLKLSKGSPDFSFTPRGLKLSTPAISYSEAKEVKGSGPVEMIEKKLFVAAEMQTLKLRFDQQWEVSAAAAIQINGIPYPVSLLLSEAPITATFTLNKAGVEVKAEGKGLPQFKIPDLSKLISEATKVPLPEIGESFAGVTKLSLRIGSDITLAGELGIGLPSKLNEALGFEKTKFIRTWVENDDSSLLKLEIAIGTKGVEGSLTGSPFMPIKGIKDDKKTVTIDLDEVFEEKGLGLITFIKPSLSLDTKSGGFKFKGGYEIDEKRGLSIPLSPLKKILEWVNLKFIGDALPSALPVTSIDLKPEAIADFFTKTLGVKLDPTVEAVLKKLVEYSKRLPKRFTDYLSISIPRGFDFEVNITSDGGVSFSLATIGNRPLQFLFPSGMALMGVRLSKLAFGTAFGGALLKLEISVEMDQFDPFMLIGALIMDDIPGLKPHLPPSTSLSNIIKVEELLIFIVYYSGIPIPIPLFYKSLEISRIGIDGFEFHTAISFPQPKINVMKALKIVQELKDNFTTGKDLTVTRPIKFEKGKEGAGDNNITFNGGPFYLRLPKYIAKEKHEGKERGLTIGVTEQYELLNVLNLAGILFNGIRKGSVAYLIQSLDDEYRINHFRFSLFGVLEANVAWVLATPNEFATKAYKRLGESMNADKAKDMLRIVPAAKPGEQGVNIEDDEGIVIFLHGSLDIGSTLKLSAAGALSAYGRTFGSGIQFAGSAFDKLIDIELMGLVKIEGNKSLLLEGRTHFRIKNKTVFMGSLRLENEVLEAEFKTDMGLPDAPWNMRGKLKGIFKSTLFSLEGEMEWNLLVFSGKGKAEIRFSATEQVFKVSGGIKIGDVLSLNAGVAIVNEGPAFAASAFFKGSVLNLLELDLNGALSIGPGDWGMAGNGSLKIMGKQVVAVSILFSSQVLRLTGELDLFPGISGIVFKGGIDCSLNKEQFSLVASSQFTLGPFSAGATLTIRSGKEGSLSTLQLNNFFNSNVTLSLQSSSSGGVRFKSSASGPIRLFLGAVWISDAADMMKGPSLELAWNADALQELFYSGKLSLLGVADASTSVRYSRDQQQMDMKVVAALTPGSPFTAAYTLTSWLRKDRFGANTTLHMMLDIGRVLSEICKNVTGIWINPLDIKVGFALNNMRIEILGERLPNNPESEQHRNTMREEFAKRIRALEDKLNAAIGVFEKHINEVDTAAKLAGERANREAKDSPRYKILMERYQRLFTLSGELTFQLNLFKENTKTLLKKEGEKGDAERARYPVADKVDKAYELEKKLEQLSTGWRNAIVNRQPTEPYSTRYEIAKKAFYDVCYKELGFPMPTFSHDRIPDNVQFFIDKKNHYPDNGGYLSDFLKWRKLMVAFIDKLLEPYDSVIGPLKREIEILDGRLNQTEGEIRKRLNEAQSLLVMNELDEKLLTEHRSWDKGRAYHIPLEANNAVTDLQAGDEAYVNHTITYAMSISFQLPLLPNMTLPEVRFSIPLSGIDFSQPLLNQMPAIISKYMVDNLFAILDAHFQSLWNLGVWLLQILRGGYSADPNAAQITMADLLKGYGALTSKGASIVAEEIGKSSEIE